MFSTQSDNCSPFVHIFHIISLFAAEFEEPKIGISGKGLTTSSNCVVKDYNIKIVFYGEENIAGKADQHFHPFT